MARGRLSRGQIATFVGKPMASDIARSRFGRPVGRLRRSSYGPVTSLSAARGPRPDTSVRPVTRGPIAIPDWHCRLPFPIRDLLRRGRSVSDNCPCSLFSLGRVAYLAPSP